MFRVLRITKHILYWVAIITVAIVIYTEIVDRVLPLITVPNWLSPANLLVKYDNIYNQKFDDKNAFMYSPDKRYIAFSENVFEENGENWDRYAAVKVFDPKTRTEKTVLVDGHRLSNFEWIEASVLRVYHNAGTGVRAYRDIDVEEFKETLYAQDQVKQGLPFWVPDKKYAREAQSYLEAWRVYAGINPK